MKIKEYSDEYRTHSDKSNQLIKASIQQFLPIALLGEGSYGEVYLVEHTITKK